MAHVKIKSSDIVCEILQILYVSVSVNHLFRGKKNIPKGVNWICSSVIIHDFRWFGLSLGLKRVIWHVSWI